MLPKMTDVEIVERTISQLTDKRDRITQRSTAISDERQSLGFDVHANDDKAARAKLDKLNAEAAIDGILRTREQGDPALMWREEQAAILAAGGDPNSLAAVAPAAADGDAQAGAGSHPSSPPAAPAQVETAEEKMARVNNQSPPAHYLKLADEPWRRHIDASGEIIAPYWRGGHG